MAAWKQACGFTGTVILLIPKGKYLIGPIKFTGPCTNVSSINVRMKVRFESFYASRSSLVYHLSLRFYASVAEEMSVQGYLKATTDLSRYGSSAGWVEFAWVDGLTLTGGGTFDGQGAKAWPYNKCTIDSSCQLLPIVCFMI